MSPTHSIPIRTFYRIVWTDPPTVVDVSPDPEHRPNQRFVRPEYERLKSGISVFRTATQARRTAINRPPWLGRGYIAAIELPGDTPFMIERTTLSKGHYTLWANPRRILAWIVAVEPVALAGDN